ncbi:MAG: glutamyl-tRNA reductase [Gammaproteobacteria bacterium 39-13]|mgnify:FL=1|nr:glutamyl-tRNA reductase [Gammaproteobacteria bacterium]OJV89818.1 MAG: glutamyl-tRNA reductase [Gammaproteobacteria bacterium 39-13]
MLLTIGVSHKTAPIEVREKLAFSQEHIPDALRKLVDALAFDEVALLSTCNRTEFYCSTPSMASPLVNEIQGWWQQHAATSFSVDPYLYAFSGEKAAAHIMRVASGLDSMIMGEPQILGQLKTAYQTANQIGMVGRKLSRLFQTSFSVAKRVRSQTKIAKHPVSVAYAAVTLAKQIFSDLSQATVMLIGAGNNVELTLQHLKAKAVKHIYIVNRTLSNAEKLASRFNGQALPLDDFTSALGHADIIISSIDCAKPFLTQSHIEQAFSGRKRRPVFMVDLGVPRNIESSIGNNEDIYLYTIDDLQGIVSENIKLRQDAAIDAEVVIQQASDAYMRWVGSQQQLHAVRALRAKAHFIKNQTLKGALKQLKKGEDPHKVLEHFAHQLTQKLLHQPTIGLKTTPLDESHDKMDLVKELFNIE